MPDLILILDRQKHEIRHQANGVARRPVLACLLVVVLVELADQFLEDRAHRVVVDAGRRKVDVGVEKLVDQRADRIGLGEGGELVAEFEIVENVLDVRREAIEVILEIGEQLLLAAARFQVAQRELRGVVEGLPRRLAERGTLLGDARLVQHLLGVKHGLLGGLQHRVHAPDDAHRQDDIGVFAALEEVAQDIVGDAPDERNDFVVRCLIHFRVLLALQVCPKSEAGA